MVACTVLVLGTAHSSAGPCSQQIADVSKQLAASDAGSGPTTGSPAPIAGDQKGQHPGTSLMSKETEGKAISPQDVQRQTGVKSEASQALEHARALDAQGNEAECMSAVKRAKAEHSSPRSRGSNCLPAHAFELLTQIATDEGNGASPTPTLCSR